MDKLAADDDIFLLLGALSMIFCTEDGILIEETGKSITLHVDLFQKKRLS